MEYGAVITDYSLATVGSFVAVPVALVLLLSPDPNKHRALSRSFLFDPLHPMPRLPKPRPCPGAAD